MDQFSGVTLRAVRVPAVASNIIDGFYPFMIYCTHLSPLELGGSLVFLLNVLAKLKLPILQTSERLPVVCFEQGWK